MRTAFVTGADRGLGLSMTKRLAQKGWRVFAGSYLPDWPELTELAQVHFHNITLVELDIASDQTVKRAMEQVNDHVGHLDLIINNAGVSSHLKDTNIRGNQDYGDLLRLYNINALGMLRVTNAFLPLISQSDMKRLCFVTSEAGSISECHREAWYGYCMSKASLNMGVKLLFNALRPKGYTFRLFHPGWMKTYMSGNKNLNAELEPDEVAAYALSFFINSRCKSGEEVEDEESLLMRDWSGRDWPW